MFCLPRFAINASTSVQNRKREKIGGSVEYGRSKTVKARTPPLSDFEDALVASIVEARGSDRIATRNVADIAGSPVQSVSPMEFLETIAGIQVE
jgi:hypothetical protein